MCLRAAKQKRKREEKGKKRGQRLTGETTTFPILNGTLLAQALASSPLPTVLVALVQTINSVVGEGNDDEEEEEARSLIEDRSRIRPSTTIPNTPRTRRRVARISPTTAQVWFLGCWIRAMVPGLGRSVQCVLVLGEMFDSGRAEDESVDDDDDAV